MKVAQLMFFKQQSQWTDKFSYLELISDKNASFHTDKKNFVFEKHFKFSEIQILNVLCVNYN